MREAAAFDPEQPSSASPAASGVARLETDMTDTPRDSLLPVGP